MCVLDHFIKSFLLLFFKKDASFLFYNLLISHSTPPQESP